MNRLQYLLVLVLVPGLLSAGGCSAPGARESKGAESSPALPQWAQTAHSHQQVAGEHLFIGQGDSRAAARHDALEQLAHQVGAEITSASRLAARAQYKSSDIAEQVRDDQRYLGVDARVFVRNASFEYAERGETNYARMSLGAGDFEQARERIDRDYRYQMERAAAVEQRLQEQRLTRMAGDEMPSRVFARATGHGSAHLESGASRFDLEHSAMRQARHQAQVELVREIHGSADRSITINSGEQHTGSSSVSQGQIQREEIGQRIWWLGEEVRASVTLFGWANQSEE